MQTPSQRSQLDVPIRPSQDKPQHQPTATRTTLRELLPPSANNLLSKDDTSSQQRQPGAWQPLAIDTSLANTLKVKTASLSPIHNESVRVNAPQRYYPGISIPSIPPPKFSPSTSQRPPKLWFPLGGDSQSHIPQQAELSMWLPASSPLNGNGVLTTYPGMALAETSHVRPQDLSVNYLSGPWYTLAALGPGSFHLTSDRERILTYITGNAPIPAQHLWSITAELYLCKKHYARSSNLDIASNWDCTDCAWDLSPYLRVMYDIDVLEGDIDSMYERLARFTNRGSPMWGLKVEPEDKVVWEAMANEADNGFNRLALESKKQVFEKWKSFCWDVNRNVAKRLRVL